MRIIFSPVATAPTPLSSSEKLPKEELDEFNSLMTTLFKDKQLPPAASSRLDFLAKKQEKAPFSMRPTDKLHQFELVMQTEVSDQTKLQDTELHTKVKTGTAAEVRELVRAHPEWVNCRNLRGQTPLTLAIEAQTREFNRLEVVKVLVEAGADVNLGDKDHWTPLYRASRVERLDILNYIAPLGAKDDINLANLDARSTPLMRMVDSGTIDGTNILLSFGPDINAVNDLGSSLYYAAKNGNTQLVTRLHGAGADLNKVKDALGLTPLGVAQNSNLHEVVAYLKAQGASAEPSPKDYTPLHQLVLSGTPQAILESAKRQEKDLFGRTVAHYCAALGKLELLRQMDPKLLDEKDVLYQRAPLHYAVIHGREETVRWMITETKCDLYSEDKAKHFPLTWAAQFGRENIARQLLQVATSRNEQLKMLSQTDNYGWTAFHKAAKHNQALLVSLFLKDYSVDPTQKTGRGLTAVQLAREVEANAVLVILEKP